MNYCVDWTTPHAEEWSKRLGHLKDKKAVGLEIGCFEGRSSIWFCQNILTHPESTLICVDPWYGDTFKTFMGNIRESKINTSNHGTGCKFRIQKVPSHLMVTLKIPPLDFAYIDGNHEAQHVLRDGLMVWQLLKPGGVLIFDDYTWTRGYPNQPQLTEKQLPKYGIDSFIDLMGEKFLGVTKTDQVIGIKAP